MFKSLVPAIVLASALGAPAFAYAQDADTVSRPAVKADLLQMEQSGYNVEGDHATYPAQTQAAEQRVEANRGITSTSYGSPTDGSYAAGVRAPMAQPVGTHSIYFGH
jgi:Domain of unknown function (DUF4148)